ncbi:thiamine pyrophosphate-dependent enzyme [Diaminobutyricibacter sp. McL0618]|uniref:thiamine pyrophosphate-dependent enzyme n=1 Tax=Leifsonia sp. McL0618 TaxID=3415677 RepID=UPI003CF067B0
MDQSFPRTGGQLIVDQLEAEGTTTAFCVPGESYLGVLDALHDSTINLVTCRHEGGAGYMAIAHGRITESVGVCLVTRGPGGANAMVAIHTAHQDSVPLLVLVGLVPRNETDRESFQEFDLTGWFATTSKGVFRIDSAARAPEIISRAFALARSGRPGPVVVGLPEDMLTDVSPGTVVSQPIRSPAPVATEATVRHVQELLAGAERPLIVLGAMGWTSSTSTTVQRWAERNNLPVAVEFNSLDLIDNNSPSFIGALGYGRSAEVAQALQRADLVVGLGSPLGDVVTDSWNLLPIQHPDVHLVTVLPDSAGFGGAAHVDELRISSDLDSFVAALDTTHSSVTSGASRTSRLRAAFDSRRTPTHSDAPLDLPQLFQHLRHALRDDAIISWGAGNHASWAARYLRWRSFPSLLAPRNGSMGFGVPAAVAAAIAFPDRQVVSIAGDGCFLMNGQELAVAAAHGVAPVIIVLNNSKYGTIRAHQETRYPHRTSGTDLVNPDFSHYARAFGGHGEIVTTTDEFPPALERSIASGLPSIIEVRVTDGRLSPDDTIESIRNRGTS